MTNAQAIEQYLDDLLEQAAAFVRAGDLTGAVERARFARKELSCHLASFDPDRFRLTEMQARVEHRIVEYEALLREWQARNRRRHAAYLKRERALIETSRGFDAGAAGRASTTT